uniref:Chemokine interleukin-8-like domain-containing protein n=1 Tax=Crocodylus porosus TaxID=8502 RepID=A0A7M4E8A4_CROPO
MLGNVVSQIIRKGSCIDLSTKELDVRGFANYETQNIAVKAVMFITKAGIKICVDSNLKWVKQVIKYLYKKTRHRKICQAQAQGREISTNPASAIG